MIRPLRIKLLRYAIPAIVAAALGGCGSSSGGGSSVAPTTSLYHETALVSDQSGVAANTDPQLVDAWGIADAPGGAFWVNDNGTGLSTLYNTTGVKQGLEVTIPPPSGSAVTAAPTGMVYNTSGFNVGGAPASFIFGTEDGTISGWNSGSSATLEVDNSAAGAVYKGLALGESNGASQLYAANFHSGMVDVFNSSYSTVGSFTDPSIPAGYAPFNVANINGLLYVTFAKQMGPTNHDEVDGPGLGYLDTFNMDGTNPHRLVSQAHLNAPWGMVVAPSTFGQYGNDLLVGNFGDGTINVYNPTSGAYLGTLDTAVGTPLAIPGLWALIFGNGGQGGNTGTLYFSAGPDNEAHGLFGSITTP